MALFINSDQSMDAWLMKRIKELEDTSRRLKKVCAEERVVGEIVREEHEKADMAD